jgi:hypothetical protein
VNYLDRWIKIDQLDVTCFISLFTVQHVSNVSTSFFRSLLLIVDLFHVSYYSGSMCVGVTLWIGWGGVVSLWRLKLCLCLLLTSVSTCFGHHYAHLQENKGLVTAFGVLFWFCWM